VVASVCVVAGFGLCGEGKGDGELSYPPDKRLPDPDVVVDNDDDDEEEEEEEESFLFLTVIGDFGPSSSEFSGIIDLRDVFDIWFVCFIDSCSSSTGCV